MFKNRDMLFLLRIGIIVGCLYVVACTSPQTNPETRVVAETAPQSDKRQTVSSDTSASDSIYTLDHVYELAGKNRPIIHAILDSIDRREKAKNYQGAIPAYKMQIARAFVASRELNPGLAIRYLRPLLSSQELIDDPKEHLFVLALISNECAVLHHTDQSIDYILQYLELARQCGDSVRYASGYLYLAENYREQQNFDACYQYLREGQRILKRVQGARSLEFLLWSLELEIDYFADQQQYDKAIAIAKKMITRYRMLTLEQRRQMQLDQDSSMNFRQAQNWMTLAGLYAHDGQMKAASAAYEEAQQFLKRSPDVLSPQFNGLTFDYLKTAGRYSEALACASRYVDQTRTDDTMNLFHLEAKRLLSEAHRLVGNYQQAWFYEHQVGGLTDSLNARTNQQTVLELQAVYETAQQERQIQQQQLVITRNRQIIFTLSIGLIALLLVLAQIAISRHKISCKNRKLFEQIEQLSRAQKELERIRTLMEENPAKQSRVSAKDKLYTRLEALMRERRLFLQPDLNREQVAAELGTNKLYLANAISEHADLTFTEYINRWRLEYARELLAKDHTTKIEAIAQMCGFNSVRTFYRLFQQTYQLTPTEFRRLSKIDDAAHA